MRNTIVQMKEAIERMQIMLEQALLMEDADARYVKKDNSE